MKSIALVGMSLLASLSFAQRNVTRTYDLLAVNWHVSLDEKNHAISGDVTNTLAPLASLQQIRFDSGKLSIDKVLVDGKTASFDVQPDALIVKLSSLVAAGKRVAVRILYHGQPEAGIYFVPA